MVTTLIEGFNTQAAGTVPSTANTGFSGIFIPGGSTAVVDTALKYEGAGSLDGSGSSYYVQDRTADTQGFEALYLYPELDPSANVVLLQARTTNASGAIAFEVQMMTSRVLRIRNSSSAAVATMTTALPLNTWSRIEVGWVNGTCTLRVFTGANLEGTTPTEEVVASYANTVVDWVAVGQITAATFSWHLDTVRTNPDTWVGPLVAPPPAPAGSGWQVGSIAM